MCGFQRKTESGIWEKKKKKKEEMEMEFLSLEVLERESEAFGGFGDTTV